MSARKQLDSNVDNAFFGGFPSLRPIQETAIKPIIEGRYEVACSGTGSGRTEVAIAPLVSRYRHDLEKTDSTVILIHRTHQGARKRLGKTPGRSY